MFKIAREGYPFIAAFAALTVVVYVLAYAFGARWIAIVPLTLTLFMFYFFRDPERTPEAPESNGGYLSPADGRVIVVKDAFEGTNLKSDALQISIFMSPFDVHINRAPCEGEVVSIKHTPGGFRAAYSDEAFLKNENTAMVMKCGDDAILLRQVAGFLARRTVNRKGPGDRLSRGERFGMIKFSSRLDVYLPKGTIAKIRVGDRVKAGQTVIGVKP